MIRSAPLRCRAIGRRAFLVRCGGIAGVAGLGRGGCASRAAGAGGFRERIAGDITGGMARGVVVFASRGGTTLVHEAFGLARADPAATMRMDSIFDVASVTKAMATAAACTICVDEGLVSMDAPVGRYLPAIAHEGRDVPLRDLASHMSGFDNAKHFLPEVRKGANPVDAILRERPVRKPGEMYSYACINFMLLGLVVEAVSGRRLDAFCEEHIFKPLGMSDTRFGPIDGGDPRVVRMVNAEPGVISDEPARAAKRPLGNAGLFSTAADMARFAEMLLGGGSWRGVRILSSESVALFERPLNRPPHHPRSLGWDMGPELLPPGLSARAYYHTGWTGQTLYVDPGSAACAIVLSNRTGDHDRAKVQRREIAAAMLAETARESAGRGTDGTCCDQEIKGTAGPPGRGGPTGAGDSQTHQPG